MYSTCGSTPSRDEKTARNSQLDPCQVCHTMYSSPSLGTLGCDVAVDSLNCMEEATNMSSISPTKTRPPLPEPTPPSLLTQFFRKLHPSTCLSSMDPDLPIDVAIPLIMTDLAAGPKQRQKGLLKLYGLTDQRHKEYR